MIGGTEWMIDAYGCAPARLASLDEIEALLQLVVEQAGLNVVSRAAHAFPSPGGVTAMYLLSESHLTIHTFPEAGLATINLYCCRPRPELDWSALCRRALGAAEVTVRRATRGAELASSKVA